MSSPARYSRISLPNEPAFNQRDLPRLQVGGYVREALLAVLAQDLPNLEVIIGNDASPDKTRQINDEEVTAYRGRARIIIMPPSLNVGVIQNFNRCVDASSGDIFVAAAGDDVRCPYRLRRIAEFFRDNPDCTAHYSNARVTDAAGGVLHQTWYHHQGILLRKFDSAGFHLYQGVQFCGATGSYRADVFRKSPPMLGRTGGEDAPAILRALLLGRAAVDSEMPLEWRWQGANMSPGGKPKNLGWLDRFRRAAA